MRIGISGHSTCRVIDLEPGLSGHHWLLFGRLDAHRLTSNSYACRPNSHESWHTAVIDGYTECRVSVSSKPTIDRSSGNPHADLVGLDDRPFGRQRIGDKNRRRRRAQAHHFPHQLPAIQPPSRHSKNQPLVKDSMGHQRAPICFPPIDVVAVFRLVRGKRDPPMTQRNQVFDALRSWRCATH